jgi:hypothetical protein
MFARLKWDRAGFAAREASSFGHDRDRTEPARRLVGIALRFRVKAICLNAQAEALPRRISLFVTSHPAPEGSRRR